MPQIAGIDADYERSIMGRPRLEWRQAALAGLMVFAGAIVGAATGMILELPNLVRGVFDHKPGTGTGTLIGFCSGMLAGIAFVCIQAWNRSKLNHKDTKSTKAL
jgi:hypothetical protein